MKSIATTLLIALYLVGCSTTNSMLHLAPDYSALPVTELEQMATSVETIVAAGNENFTLEDSGSITIDTVQLNQAIRNRAIRHELLSELLDTGFATEKENGLIAIERSSAYKKARSSRQRDRDAMLVMSENENRWTIYEGLIEINEWAPRGLSAVQETFFKARVPLMAAGQRHDSVI